MSSGAQEPASEARPESALSLTWPSLGWLSLAMFGAWLPIASVAYQQAKLDGVIASMVACGVCWLSCAVALLLSARLLEPHQVMQSVGLGMLFRMGLPLGLGVFLSIQGGPLAEAGVFGMIVGFYLVGLVVETLLSLRLLKKHQQA